MRKRTVEVFNCMLAGHWDLTHHGIAFDKHGRLVDGQHRLTALAESGMTLPFWVYRAHTDQISLYLDSGAPRSVSDTFRIKGRDLASNTIIAAARRMRDGFDYSSKVGDRADLIDFMDRHHDCLVFVSDTFNTVRRHITISAVLGAFGRAYYHIPEHTLRRAAQIVQQ